MDIIYNNNINVVGQFLKTEETQNKPIVILKGLDTNKNYALIMIDPDAVGGNHIHWLVTNIKGNIFETGDEILEYFGPHPPANSGIHNYIFLLYESNYDMKDKMNSNNRQIELNDILNKLDVKGEPIYTTKFTSKHQNGGKHKRKRKTIKKTKNKKQKKTKRTK